MRDMRIYVMKINIYEALWLKRYSKQFLATLLLAH